MLALLTCVAQRVDLRVCGGCVEGEGEENRQLARDRRGQSLGCNDNNNNSSLVAGASCGVCIPRPQGAPRGLAVWQDPGSP
jgi:hypothetical protein